MDLGVSEKLKPILKEVKHFIDNEILPMESEYHEEIEKDDRWQFTSRQTEILEELKSKAKARDPFTKSLPHEIGHSTVLLDYT